MALEDILAAIAEEARTAASHIEADAAERAEALLAEERKQAEGAAQAEIARGRAASGRLGLGRERRAQAAARRLLREAREACVARSLAAAREHLRALQSGPRWPEAYAALRREAAGLVGAGAAIAASAQPLDGVVIQDGAGRGARNTLAARFQAAEPLLRQLAHEALDGGVRKEEPWSRRTTATPGSAR